MNWVNDALPWLGVAQVIYAMRSQHYFTKPSATGAFFMLALVLWLFLIWADWIEGFLPVWQTTVARLILFIMVWLVMYLVKVRRCEAY